MFLAARLLAVLAVSLAVPGCFIPYHYTDQPGVQGVVVDARSRKPVRDAEIVLGKSGQTSMRSAADGSFNVPPKKRWGVYVIPGDVFNQSYPLVVRHPGYLPDQQEVISNPLGRGEDIAQVGTVALTPTR